jgi:hypothetical protein
MTLPDWQLVSIVVSILGSAVGATAWITWKLAKADTEIKNLKENLKDAEELIQYMIRLDRTESRKAAETLRNKLGVMSKGSTKSEAGDEEA